MDNCQIEVVSLLPGLVESSSVMTDSSSLVSCCRCFQAWQRENEESSEVHNREKNKEKTKVSVVLRLKI